MDFSKTALVTHYGCMDGSASAVVFVKAGGNKKNIHFAHPGHDSTNDIVQHLSETWEGSILVVDASISLSLAEKLDARNVDIMLLDHHATAEPLNRFDWCDIDVENTRSGARMLYDYIRKHGTGQQRQDVWELKTLVLTADDVDRWQWNMPDSQALTTLHNELQQELFVERFLKDPEVEFTAREQYVIQLARHRRDKFIERKKEEAVFRMVTIDGHTLKVAVVGAGSHQSLLGNELCSDVTCGADIAVMINARSVSLRAGSDCPVDLGKIAKLNLGGGHAKAAGTAVRNILGEDFTEMVFERIKWNES